MVLKLFLTYHILGLQDKVDLTLLFFFIAFKFKKMDKTTQIITKWTFVVAIRFHLFVKK